MKEAIALIFLYDFVPYVGTTVYFALILYLRILRLSAAFGLCVRVIRSSDLDPATCQTFAVHPHK